MQLINKNTQACIHSEKYALKLIIEKLISIQILWEVRYIRSKATFPEIQFSLLFHEEPTKVLVFGVTDIVLSYRWQ